MRMKTRSFPQWERKKVPFFSFFSYSTRDSIFFSSFSNSNKLVSSVKVWSTDFRFRKGVFTPFFSGEKNRKWDEKAVRLFFVTAWYTKPNGGPRSQKIDRRESGTKTNGSIVGTLLRISIFNYSNKGFSPSSPLAPTLENYDFLSDIPTKSRR